MLIKQLEAEFEAAKKKLITAHLQKVSELELLDAVRATVEQNAGDHGDLDEQLAITVMFFDDENNSTSFDTGEPIENEEVAECLVPIMYIDPCMSDTEFELTNELNS